MVSVLQCNSSNNSRNVYLLRFQSLQILFFSGRCSEDCSSRGVINESYVRRGGHLPYTLTPNSSVWMLCAFLLSSEVFFFFPFNWSWSLLFCAAFHQTKSSDNWGGKSSIGSPLKHVEGGTGQKEGLLRSLFTAKSVTKLTWEMVSLKIDQRVPDPEFRGWARDTASLCPCSSFVLGAAGPGPAGRTGPGSGHAGSAPGSTRPAGAVLHWDFPVLAGLISSQTCLILWDFSFLWLNLLMQTHVLCMVVQTFFLCII